MNEELNLDGLAAFFKALGNRDRLRIIELLATQQTPIHIEGIARQLNEDYASIYKHLEELERVGIIGIYAVGRSRVPYIKKKDEIISLLELSRKIILQKS